MKVYICDRCNLVAFLDCTCGTPDPGPRKLPSGSAPAPAWSPPLQGAAVAGWRRSKPFRSERRRALDANQPGKPSEINGDGPKADERPTTGLTALEALENVSARKWTYRPKDAA